MKRYLSQRLKLRHLRVVTTVASQGSLLKAAESLGLTQPALTKSLREIEDIVGARIFDRHARGMQVNGYGTLLADAARTILNTLRDVEDGFDRIDCRVGGTVIVGALPTAAAGVIPAVLRKMRIAEPDIQLRVVEDRTNELYASLALGDIDLFVGRLYSHADAAGQFEQVPIYDEPMSFIVGHQHPLAERKGLSVGEISGHEISLPAATFRIGADTHAYLDMLGMKLGEGFTTTSLPLLREMLLNSELVTVMPWLMLKGDIDRGTLRVLDLANPGTPPPRQAGLVLRRDRPLTPPAARFVEVVTEYARTALPQYGS